MVDTGDPNVCQWEVTIPARSCFTVDEKWIVYLEKTGETTGLLTWHRVADGYYDYTLHTDGSLIVPMNCLTFETDWFAIYGVGEAKIIF